MRSANAHEMVRERVAAVRRQPSRRDELVALLAEQSAVYHGAGSGEADRIRAFVLTSFEDVGLPSGALPFVAEELRIGTNPYTLAATAKALRNAGRLSDDTLALLGSAAIRCASNDDVVRPDTLDVDDTSMPRTSALAEIVRTLAASGSRASGVLEHVETAISRNGISPEVAEAFRLARIACREPETGTCCCQPPQHVAPSTTLVTKRIDDVMLEDQNGRTITYGEFFTGRPTILTFFYTRCMNPQKCSLTISKLASVQRLLAAAAHSSKINVAALSYDPEYDRPDRLRIYGQDRGFRFDDRNRFLRTTGSFGPVQSTYDLAVGYGPSTVNRHSVEVFVLDATCGPVHEFRRVQWDETELVRAVSCLLA